MSLTETFFVFVFVLNKLGCISVATLECAPLFFFFFIKQRHKPLPPFTKKKKNIEVAKMSVQKLLLCISSAFKIKKKKNLRRGRRKGGVMWRVLHGEVICDCFFFFLFFFDFVFKKKKRLKPAQK